MTFETFIYLIKIFLAASIFFVWVVRYDNIVKEFNEYNFPTWFRDLIGILKITFCGILLSNNIELLKIASGSMVVLMLAAFLVHIRFRHNFLQTLPSISLLAICTILFLWG